MSSPTQGELDDTAALLENVTHLNSENTDEVEKFTELSEELPVDTEAMETEEHELVVESQEEVEHEEEVIQSEEDIEHQEVEIQSEDQVDSSEEVIEHKYKPTSNVPPLRPLNIAPKPEHLPIAVKPVSGQPLILVPGSSGGQAIKLVNTQGQEINLANYSLSRPITIKSTGKTISTNSVAQTQPKPILMKKIITTGQKTLSKPITFAKPNQQFVVVQKSGDQQVKLVQTASMNSIGSAPITKTITLQQAQEMGLLGNAKIIQGGIQPVGAKRTVLINKTQPKTIKIVPQGSGTQITTGVTKTISLAQFKSPTKILPATATNIVGGKATQRLIFKSASGNQVLPPGQLIQVGGAQGITNGQIHQINVPGKGMQYIKFVTSTSGETSNSAVTVVNTIKSTTSQSVATVVSDVKPIITATKLVTKPATASKPTQVMLVPAGYIPANIQQLQKVAIPAVKQPIQQKHVLTTVPRPVPAVTTSSPESISPSTTSTSTTTVSTNEGAPSTNGIRPRKPCNCTKSQCLKLYCDCFANGEFCYLCNCIKCFNNLENEETRNLAIKACLERNSNAFRPKIGKAKDTGGDILRKHTKGCNCKKSGCLKNYCECYEAKIACSNNCKCVGCRNVEDTFEKKTLEMNASTQRIEEDQLTQTVYRKILPHYKGLDLTRDLSVPGRKKSSSRKQPITYITDEVIEATCQCLLTTSDDADSNQQDEETTKRQIIEEFGGCLKEIIHCSLNRT